jgi:AcrR family transcriptional regulator
MPFNEKQIQILEAAEKLFAEQGFEGASVRDIAEMAKINIAMISYYFGSKEKLFESLFIYRFEDAAQKLEKLIRDKDLTPIEKMDALIDYYIDKFMQQRSFHKIIMREQVADKRDDTSVLISAYKRKNQLLVKTLIHEGQKSCAFTKNIDVPLLTATLVGTIGHVVATQHFYREINNLQDMPEGQFQKLIRKKISHHLKLLFRALMTHETGNKTTELSYDKQKG